MVESRASTVPAIHHILEPSGREPTLRHTAHAADECLQKCTDFIAGVRDTRNRTHQVKVGVQRVRCAIAVTAANSVWLLPILPATNGVDGPYGLRTPS